MSGRTEVTGGSYARVAVTAGLTQWAGTQSAGSTTASSGTGGTTSNNATVTFPAPTANWGVVLCWGLTDASTAGNIWVYSTLTTSKTINNGDAAQTLDTQRFHEMIGTATTGTDVLSKQSHELARGLAGAGRGSEVAG